MDTRRDGQVSCRDVEEALADVVTGAAPQALYDHIAECDACRDARFEAERAGALIADAGADFVVPDGFAERLVSAVLEARPDGVRSDAVRSDAVRSDAVRSDAVRSDAVRSDAVRSDLEPSAAVTNELMFAPTQLGPAPTPSEGAPPAQTLRSVRTPPISLPTASAHTAPGASTTVPETPSHLAPEVEVRVADVAPAAPKKVVRARSRWPLYALGGAASLAAAAALAFALLPEGAVPGSALSTTGKSAWSGKIEAISRASGDKGAGLSVCDEDGACHDADVGAAVAEGSTLRTDARTRARVRLGDGSLVSLDRATELSFVADVKRTARLGAGLVVAEIARNDDGPVARLVLPTGEVEASEGRFALTATKDRTTVEVARGTAHVRGASGDADVRAGEEATVLSSGAPSVYASTLSDAASWGSGGGEEGEPLLRGLGELRARRPGQTTEKDRAVRLARHGVKVRIVDLVARTEVDETFANDTDEELEGIFRFPLPPGAQIEQLALEVDGKLIDGAFVDRDKGAAIWRGVLQNAAPKTPRTREEIIWVPGPWRDPALLEWQRGGRFELKIFPIPKRGSRRVVLTYTQVVEQSGGVRRFTYPLAHDERGTTNVGAFDLDVEVRGHDASWGVRSRGYELTRAAGDGSTERLGMHADGFVPAGDLTLEYALPDRARELTAWAFDMGSSAQPSLAVEPASPRQPRTHGDWGGGSTSGSPPPGGVAVTEPSLRDPSPFVAIAVRPKLPRWQEQKERVHVLVVDTSRSMFGERYARATRLASTVVREMDRRDTFLLLGCDSTCKPFVPSGEESRGPRSFEPQHPGPEAAAEVERFLGGIEPDGASDLAAAVEAARSAAGRLDRRELRIVYLGDGTPSVGPTRPAHLEAAVRAALPGRDGAVIAVGLGADCDTTSLAALARGGGGVVVPYVPGQTLTAAALDVLSAAYGVMLRDPVVELPPGLTAVTPAVQEPVRAGGEMMVYARMTRPDAIEGTLRLTGRVGDEPFEQSYPLRVVPTTSAGNAFVPRLYAASRIGELELLGDPSSKASAIALSQRFAVASRFTSLLVLESEAMFNAFGLERNRSAPSFTGEVTARSESFDAENEPDADAPMESALDDLSREESAPAGLGKASKGKADFDGNGFGANGYGEGSAAPASRGPSAAAPAPTMAPPAKKPAPIAGDFAEAPATPPWDGRRDRGLVPMRKVFDRKASFEANNTLADEARGKLFAAEEAHRSAPDSRDKTVALYALYATTGRLGEAQDLTARWSGRDALDPEALVARADLAARQGDRERAVRILGGLADVRPGDKEMLRRLAGLHEAAEERAAACQHRVALAEVARTDANLLADALRCSERRGQTELVAAMKRTADAAVRTAAERILTTRGPDPANATATLAGDVRVTAEWQGSEDLDVALVDVAGRRLSWMGAPGKIVATARDPRSLRTEALGFVGLPSGRYVVEVTRAGHREGNAPVRGEITLTLAGETRRVPFVLDGDRVELGVVRVFFQSRLVPANDVWGGRW